MKSRGFADLFERAERRDAYWIAGLEMEFTEELCRLMEEQGVSRAELARRAGTSPAYITKILRGNTNFTLATMAKLARALGMEVRLHLAPRGSRTVWKDVISAPLAWPEGPMTVRQRLSSGGDVEEREPAPALLRKEGRPVGEWTAFSSAASEWKGDDREGTSDQVA